MKLLSITMFTAFLFCLSFAAGADSYAYLRDSPMPLLDSYEPHMLSAAEMHRNFVFEILENGKEPRVLSQPELESIITSGKGTLDGARIAITDRSTMRTWTVLSPNIFMYYTAGKNSNEKASDLSCNALGLDFKTVWQRLHPKLEDNFWSDETGIPTFYEGSYGPFEQRLVKDNYAITEEHHKKIEYNYGKLEDGAGPAGRWIDVPGWTVDAIGDRMESGGQFEYHFIDSWGDRIHIMGTGFTRPNKLTSLVTYETEWGTFSDERIYRLSDALGAVSFYSTPEYDYLRGKEGFTLETFYWEGMPEVHNSEQFLNKWLSRIEDAGLRTPSLLMWVYGWLGDDEPNDYYKMTFEYETLVGGEPAIWDVSAFAEAFSDGYAVVDEPMGGGASRTTAAYYTDKQKTAWRWETDGIMNGGMLPTGVKYPIFGTEPRNSKLLCPLE